MTEKSRRIIVSSKPAYESAQSDPDRQKFVFSYEITVSNESDEIVQLLNRVWLITDLTGKIEEVSGPGVVGLQPVIKPGKQFVYSSYCQLLTPQGTMEGHYLMQNLDEEQFEVEIPKFILSAPSSVTKLYRSRLH